MQWSKNILRKETAEKQVLEYVPQKFELGTPAQALDYLRTKKHGADFTMSEVIRVQTGVEEIEKVSEQERIEGKALEKLKEIQEQAYREAYELGLDEGHKRAFEAQSAEIDKHLKQFSVLIHQIEKMKQHMLAFNESHLVQLMYHMASKLAQTHLKSDNQAVVEVVRNSVTLAQDEEDVVVRVSNEQFDFLEQLKKVSNREYDFLKKIKLEPADNVASGGCIVETNYGEVDSRIEKRVEQLWLELVDNMPKVKDKLEGHE